MHALYAAMMMNESHEYYGYGLLHTIFVPLPLLLIL